MGLWVDGPPLEQDGEVAESFDDAELVCIDRIPSCPLRKLRIRYNRKDVSYGNRFETSDLKFAPKIKFFDVDLDAMYTLGLFDVDNLSRKCPLVSPWLQWLVVNIPASNLVDEILGGKTLMPYGSPCPGPRTGPHRVVFLLWQHPQYKIEHEKQTQRGNFDIKHFQEMHRFGDPVAGNFFITQHKDN